MRFFYVMAWVLSSEKNFIAEQVYFLSLWNDCLSFILYTAAICVTCVGTCQGSLFPLYVTCCGSLLPLCITCSGSLRHLCMYLSGFTTSPVCHMLWFTTSPVYVPVRVHYFPCMSPVAVLYVTCVCIYQGSLLPLCITCWGSLCHLYWLF